MLFVGDDWSEEHHDVEVVDDDGRRLASVRLPEGLEGVTRLDTLVARFVPAEWTELDSVEAASLVKIGIETDRGGWVAALVAAGYEVFAINPMSVARYRERHSTSGAKSDAGDAHVLAEIVRLDRAHHRRIAADTSDSQAMKLVARSHQSLIWDRNRHVLRLRSALREYFPAALVAFEDLYAPDALELLGRAPDPDRATRLSAAKIGAALKRANRRKIAVRTEQIQAALRAPALRQPPVVQAAFAAIAAGEINVISTLNTQIATVGEVVAERFGRHPESEVYASQPGLGVILGARVLAEFGDAPGRYVDARARKNYAGTSPITRASGTKKVVLARYARNQRLADAIRQWAMSSLRGHPARGTTTTRCVIERSATKRRYGSSATGSSGSCTGASTLARSTTKPSPGPTTSRPLLDKKNPGMSARIAIARVSRIWIVLRAATASSAQRRWIDLERLGR